MPKRKPIPKSFPSVAQMLAPTTPAEDVAARQKFVRGLIARGQAVPQGQPLPPGATHEIVGTDADGVPVLRRVRYSAK